MPPTRGFGVAGALAADIVRQLAPAAEAAGYATFWTNDTPDGDGLAALREAAAVTERIGLGVGVIPLDRQNPEAIAARIAKLGLPEDRLTVGVGSGAAGGGLARVREGAIALRGMTGARVVVGALGPRMTELAGEVADGVLLNWLTPSYAEGSVAATRKAAAGAGRPTPLVAGYVRVALGDPARHRLAAEAVRYEGYPAYAAHFARMGAGALATTVTADDPTAIAPALAAYAHFDETVVRAIAAEDTAAAYLALLHAASPRI